MIIMLWCILCFFTKHGLRTLDISTWWWSRIIIDLTPNPTVCREQLAIFHRTQTWHLKCRSSTIVEIVEIWSSARNLVETSRVLGARTTWGLKCWVSGRDFYYYKNIYWSFFQQSTNVQDVMVKLHNLLTTNLNSRDIISDFSAGSNKDLTTCLFQ